MPTKKISAPRDRDAALRQHLLELINGGHAHVDFDTAVRGLSPALRGKRPKGADHSPWEILEHLRIAQWDILEFSRDAGHESPDWPSGYWPATAHAARREGLGQECARLSPRSDCDVRSGQESGDRSVCADSARQRPNHPARGAARCRSQRLSPGTIGPDQAVAGGVEGMSKHSHPIIGPLSVPRPDRSLRL